MSKKNFLLLEILIALFLIELIAIPFMKKPIEGYKGELRSLEEVEGERLADLTFLEIKEKLYTHQIKWKDLPLVGKKKTFSLPPSRINVPGFPEKEIKREFVLQCDLNREKETLSGEIYRLLKVRILFSPVLTRKKTRKGEVIPPIFEIAVKKEAPEKETL